MSQGFKKNYVYHVIEGTAICIFEVVRTTHDSTEVICNDLWNLDEGLSTQWDYFAVYAGIQAKELCKKEDFKEEYPEYIL